MSGLPRKVKIYISFIAIIGAVLLGYMITRYSIPSFGELIFWSILSVVTESLLILLPNGTGISVGFAIGLGALMTGGPLLAALVTAIGVAFRIVDVPKKGYSHIFNTPPYKILFNASQSIIVTGCAGIIYHLVSNKLSYTGEAINITSLVIAMVVYIALNTVIIAKLFSLLSGQSFINIWMDNIKGTFLNSLAVGTLGIIIALAYISYSYVAVILFFGPLLLARYSFKLYLDTKHFYMETVEALNRTMEAKDPYTSGHASRVGEYAIKLGRELNLSNKMIENIRTAAVLHDIGKIGIDDIILKKPGKLTKEEYEDIQRHPAIGAQILKDVVFLKDVVKIVRGHHERYDGKGYPDGIKGEEIPVEAAILSISDVYDAMTSDRPYRKALSTEIALDEIEKNAGTQLHPEYAKAFVNMMKKEIKKENVAHAN